MSIIRSKRKGQSRVSRSRKAIGKTAEKMACPPSTTGANLVYAGYPYDPYA